MNHESSKKSIVKQRQCSGQPATQHNTWGAGSNFDQYHDNDHDHDHDHDHGMPITVVSQGFQKV